MQEKSKIRMLDGLQFVSKIKFPYITFPNNELPSQPKFFITHFSSRFKILDFSEAPHHLVYNDSFFLDEIVTESEVEEDSPQIKQRREK